MTVPQQTADNLKDAKRAVAEAHMAALAEDPDFAHTLATVAELVAVLASSWGDRMKRRESK